MSNLSNVTVTKIHNVSFIHKLETETFTMNSRPGFGLSFCKSGEIIYHHNEKRYTSRQNCAVILPKNATYNLECRRDGIFPLINFDSDNFNQNDFLVIPLRNAESYIKDTQKLRDMMYFPENHLKCMMLFYDILERLSNEGFYQNPFLHTVMDYIENNFCDVELDNTKLSQVCGLSESHFRKLFRESRGVSPKQYILEVRIKKAKILLRETHKSITVISDECGFASVYHFCRAFKGICSCTPTEYRSRRFVNGI